MDDFHGAPAEDIAGAHQHRVADELGHLERFVEGGDARAGRLRDAQLGEESLEAAAVLGQVDGLGAGADDGHAGAW